MPLPTTNQPWPPTDARVQSDLADWDAWYSADPDRLEFRYGGGRRGSEPYNRPSQYATGVRGRVARWFWGNPIPAGEPRDKVHVPLAGDIARTSAVLLFSEPPALISDHQATQDRLDDVAPAMHPTLLEGGELGSALGGTYLRIVWDGEVSDRPWTDAVAADRAVPEFRYGRLYAVTFWTVLPDPTGPDGRRVFRHLERHEKGRIYHGLYEGGSGDLGAPRPLQDHPVTAPLAEEVDAAGGLDTGAPDHLTAAYAPNVRPARSWRHIPSAASLGQSDFQGIETLLDRLDMTYSSWMRDIDNGRGRIIVPNSMLESLGPGQGAAWNPDKHVYTGLNMLQRPGDPSPLEVVQFEIRVAEHRDTCAEIIEQAVRQAGYSASTFGETGDGAAITATEIRARERRSMATRARKALYWGPAIADITAALLAVEAGPRFGVSGLDVSEPIKVEFQDSVSDGPTELATTAELMRRGEAASTDTIVRMLHPDWDDTQVKAEVDLILGESGRVTADPTMTGAEGEGVPHAGFPSAGGGSGN